MASLATITDDLDRLLTPQSFRDYGPNGVQVPGTRDIDTIATSVSASHRTAERAAEEGAQALLVHHGLFWKGMPQEVTPALHRRLRPLFVHDVALLAYHLPLDAHETLGNNAILARELQATSTERFGELGFTAHFDGAGVPKAELIARVKHVTKRDPLHLDFGPDHVRKLAIVSGSAADMAQDAIDQGCDAFLTGEPAERVFSVAREGGIHFLGAGHYATETFGVRALGEHLAQRFGIRHVWLDDPNPI